MTATTFSLFTLDAFFKLGDWAIYLTAPLMMGIAAHTPSAAVHTNPSEQSALVAQRR